MSGPYQKLVDMSPRHYYAFFLVISIFREPIRPARRFSPAVLWGDPMKSGPEAYYCVNTPIPQTVFRAHIEPMIFAQTLDSAPVRLPQRVDYWRNLSLLAALLVAASLQADDRVEITYGWVTEHYQTRWSDPTLPAGVARGIAPLPPITESDIAPSDAAPRQSAPRELLTQAASTPQPADSAVLFTLDLGDQGMEMIVSAKSHIRPGDCIARERSGDSINLRRVHPAYCDNANAEAIATMHSVNQRRATDCAEALRTSAAEASPDDERLRRIALQLRCDGS